MTTLDDAAERRIAQLVGDFYDGQRTMESAVDAAWREGAAAATESAAKKWQADAERYQWLKSESASSRSAMCAVAWKYKEACADEVNAAGVDAIVDAGRAASIQRGTP